MLGHTALSVRVAGEVEVLQHHCILRSLGYLQLHGLCCWFLSFWITLPCRNLVCGEVGQINLGCRTASEHRYCAQAPAPPNQSGDCFCESCTKEQVNIAN